MSIKRLMERIISELQDIKKLLEPKLTTERDPSHIPRNLMGGCSTSDLVLPRTIPEYLLYTTREPSADQKPRLPESVKDIYSTPHNIPNFFIDPFYALRRLYYLRQAYWQAEGWEPDWTDYKEEKYSIYYVNEVLEIHKSAVVRSFLTLPTLAQAEHFLKHHHALIEQAKELL